MCRQSDYVQTNCLQSTFGNESWSILSDIERSIKSKVETVGLPLREWDVQIYRGILTGYNEAFIISSKKRDEILANCADEEERERTASMLSSSIQLRGMKFWMLVEAKMNARGRRKSFDRFSVAGIFEDMPMIGQIYG